jgi:hypothetical protein
MERVRLNQVGKEVAQQVQGKQGVDEISFGTLESTDGRVSASGYVRRAAKQQLYFLDSEKIHKLLHSPEGQVRQYLEMYLTETIQRILQ